MEEDTFEHSRQVYKSGSDPYRLPIPSQLPHEHEATSESSSSGHSHSRSHSYQHFPIDPPSSSASNESSSRHFRNPSPSLSSPPSPSSSTSSFATSSRRRPLPSPPTDMPRFVPFRAPPPPPPSLSSQSSAYDEKRELARLRGLDDLIERNEASEEEEEEEEGLSPTTSDLPEYEESKQQGPRMNASLGKAALGRLDEDVEANEGQNEDGEREEMRRRARQESARLLEEDNRSTKERLLEERRRYEEENRRAREMELEVEEEKRNEELAWRERIDSPPPPLSPTSNMLPIGDTKERWTAPSRPSETLHHSQTARFVDYSALQQLAYPAPPPRTTLSSSIPSIPAQDMAHHRPSQFARAPHAHYSTPTQNPLSNPLSSFYGGPPRPSGSYSTNTLHSSSTPQLAARRQGSLGPASSFYSSAVGLTMEQLRIDDRQHSPLPQTPFENHTPSFVPSPLARSPSPVRAEPFEAARQSQTLHYSLPSSTFSLPPSLPSLSPQPPQPAPAPAFYHQVGGVLLPFYPASNAGQPGSQTYISPASAVSSLPPPPPVHAGYQSLGPIAYGGGLRPASAQQLGRSSTQSSPSPQPFYPFPAPTSPSPHSHHSLSPPPVQPSTRIGNRRMSTIKNLFGRKSEKARDSRGQGPEWVVQEES